MALNHIVLVGTVDRAPEKRITPDGVATTLFKVKVVRPPRQEGGPSGFDLLPIVATRRVADLAADLKPGEVVAVEGRLVAYSYQENGQPRKRIDVDATSVVRVGAGGEMPEPATDVPAPVAVGGGAYESASEGDLDDSIPF